MKTLSAALSLLVLSTFARIAGAVPLEPLVPIDAKSDMETLKSQTAPLAARIQAAKTLAERAKKDKDAGKVATELYDIGARFATPPDLRNAIADAIGDLGPDEAAKMLLRHTGASSAQEFEKLFVLRAARTVVNAELDKQIAGKYLADADVRIRAEALSVLVKHKDVAAVPILEAIVKSGQDIELLAPTIDGISQLLDGGPQWADWEAKLAERGRDKNETIRRAALAVLSRKGGPQYLDLFLESLTNPDWSTRAIAIGYLAKSNSKRAIPALIDQMRAESSQTRIRDDCQHALERMTGMNFFDRVDDWDGWWKNNADKFEFPKSAGAPRTGPKPPKTDNGTAVAQFYGIPVVTKRVVFVIDISGSMTTPTKSPEFGGDPRIEVAKSQLTKMIDEMPPGTLFNIITFNDAVMPWLDHLGAPPGAHGKEAKNAPTTGDARGKPEDPDKQKKQDDLVRAKAKEYVARQTAARGTNIFDALEMAFEDPLVDTIFFLTDGQPTSGKEIDPAAIRAGVQRWNAARKIKMHTIAIGTDYPLLKWLSDDNGGEHKYFE